MKNSKKKKVKVESSLISFITKIIIKHCLEIRPFLKKKHCLEITIVASFYHLIKTRRFVKYQSPIFTKSYRKEKKVWKQNGKK